MLHEVKLYLDWQRYTTDEKWNKIENTSITMYQVWEDWDFMPV